MGCQVCIACETSNAIHGRDDRPLADGPELHRATSWAKFGADVEAIAEFTAAQGLTLVYHHHMGTIVESAARDRPLHGAHRPGDEAAARHRPRLFGGGDPAELARKLHAPRRPHPRQERAPARSRSEVEAEHLTFLEGVRRGVFTVPGDPEGGVDFPPVLQDRRRARLFRLAGHRGRAGPGGAQPAATTSRMGLKALKEMARAAGLDRAERDAHDPLLRKPDRRPAARCTTSPRTTAGWGYVGFGLYRLVPGETVAEPTGDTEVILVLVEGKARIGAGERDFGELGDAHGRLRGARRRTRLRAGRLRLVGDRHHRLHAGGLHRPGQGRAARRR